MPSSDLKTRNGLAVQRRMQSLGVSRNQPAPGAARLAKGMSELAWLGARLSPEGLQAIIAADARGGLQAVKAMLAGTGLTADGLAALEAQYGRGGLQPVVVSVQAQMQHEAQGAAANEAAEVLGRLAPEDWQVLATHGPVELAHQAARVGISPEAAAIAVRYMAQHGVERVQQEVAQVGRAEAMRAAGAREVAAGQKWDHLSNPQLAQAAEGFYTAHAAALEASGVGAKDGESAVSWTRRMARAGDDAAAKVAAATGTHVSVIRNIFSDARSHEDHRELRAHVLASDASARKAHAVKPQYPAFEAPKRKPDALDAAFDRAKQTVAPVVERRSARAAVSGDSAIDRAMQKAADRLDGYEDEGSETTDTMESTDE